MYKEASKLKLRFETSKGSLSVEQMWDLKMTTLATIARSLKKKLNETSGDDELSFLDENAIPVDKETQLQFDIVKDMYLTKKAELEAAKSEAETKAHNQKILGLIKQKQEEKLLTMSEEELTALLK